MRLFIITSIEEEEPCKYDTAQAFVVRAATSQQARKFAAKMAGDEGSAFWTDPKLSKCARLFEDGEEGVVLRDFKAG